MTEKSTHFLETPQRTIANATPVPRLPTPEKKAFEKKEKDTCHFTTRPASISLRDTATLTRA